VVVSLKTSDTSLVIASCIFAFRSLKEKYDTGYLSVQLTHPTSINLEYNILYAHQGCLYNQKYWGTIQKNCFQSYKLYIFWDYYVLLFINITLFNNIF